MRTKLFLFSFLMILLGLKAQSIQTSGNFKAKLLSSSASNTIAKNLSGNYFAVDADGNGDIDKNEAGQVSELNIQSSGIGELNSIFHFKNLAKLDCSNNNLMFLELQGLENLETVKSNNNQLREVYLQYNPSLKNLDLSNNVIEYINLANLISLSNINLSGNHLSGLSFQDGTTVNIQSLNVTNNPLLTTICKDISDILPSTGSVSQNTYDVPYMNPAFTTALLYASPTNMVAKNLSNQYFRIDANGDGILQLSELSQIKELDLNEAYYNTPMYLSSINSFGMSNLKKIKYTGAGQENYGGISTHFWGNLYDVDLKGSPNLESILFDDQPLRGIDISNMPHLTMLSLNIEVPFSSPANFPESGMRLKYLKGENCSSLNYIGLEYQNALERVNLKNCTSLIQFNHTNDGYNGDNYLASPKTFALQDVNLEGCSSLISTNVSRTMLTNLNVKNCPVLEEIKAYKGQLTTTDNILMTNSPNIKILTVTANRITNVDLSKIPSVEILDCTANVLTNIQGYSNKLKKLHIYNNSLTALNIHNIPNLELIALGYNKFIDLNFSGHQKLQSILIKDYSYNEFYDTNMPFPNGDNYLKSLNVNNCPNMQSIFLASSVLERLYIKNGVNETIDYFIASPSQFICCDASEAVAMQDQLDVMNNTTCAVYTDCSTTGPVLSTHNISKDKNTVNIFPSPTKGDVNVTADSKINSIEIYDAQGKIIQKQTEINSQTTKVSIQGNTSGIYIFKIITEKETFTKKIIKN